MTTAYIKFRYKDDVYALCPSYDLKPPGDGFEPPPIACPTCGDTYYIPVELPEDITFSIPSSDIYRPLPKEVPHLMIKSEPQFPTLAMYGSISHSEQQRLKEFPSMVFVDDNGFEMLIDAVSKQSVEHKCLAGAF